MIDLSGFGDMEKALVSGLKTMKKQLNKFQDKELKKEMTEILNESVNALNNKNTNSSNELQKRAEKLKENTFKKYKDSIPDYNKHIQYIPVKKWQ